jgi:hypothetical protein
MQMKSVTMASRMNRGPSQCLSASSKLFWAISSAVGRVARLF